jgi:hypothetical protein
MLFNKTLFIAIIVGTGACSPDANDRDLKDKGTDGNSELVGIDGQVGGTTGKVTTGITGSGGTGTVIGGSAPGGRTCLLKVGSSPAEYTCDTGCKAPEYKYRMPCHYTGTNSVNTEDPDEMFIYIPLPTLAKDKDGKIPKVPFPPTPCPDHEGFKHDTNYHNIMEGTDINNDTWGGVNMLFDEQMGEIQCGIQAFGRYSRGGGGGWHINPDSKMCEYIEEDVIDDH